MRIYKKIEWVDEEDYYAIVYPPKNSLQLQLYGIVQIDNCNKTTAIGRYVGFAKIVGNA